MRSAVCLVYAALLGAILPLGMGCEHSTRAQPISSLPSADSKTAWQNLGAPQLILDGNKPINVDIGHAAPAVIDLNGDGKKDLLVGQFGEGKVRVYLNQGGDESPRFEGFTYLKAGGTTVTVPYG
jgi:hypothetical protein